MMNKTKIDWCDYTWNPISGCSPISEGCKNCFAERVSARFKLPWGKPVFHPEKLEEPLRTKKPGKVFVCSMSDLFHEDVKPEWIWQIWTAMLKAPQHTFIVLTKRAKRMKAVVKEIYSQNPHLSTPLPNVWIGVTAENQRTADERIPLLLRNSFSKRFVSVEPMLGPINLEETKGYWGGIGLDWIVCGGESGAGARPMHPDWVRGLRDQCKAASVPFFFKQWGEWAPSPDGGTPDHLPSNAGYYFKDAPYLGKVWRFGKQAAGHLLDGKEHREWPV